MNGLRQRMAWLHTWGGLWCCWLAFAIFLTGTLSMFTEAISDWMRPEQPPHAAGAPYARPGNHDAQLAYGLAALRRKAPASSMWEMWPREGEERFNVYWLDAQGRYQDAHLSASTGAELPDRASTVRDTAGGNHFVEFHHELHAGKAGLWLVGAASVAMLVALVSGVITHKRIFKDFFTFRPAKGQRSWLDAHNLLGVLTLPFLFVIVYSGLAISWPTYVPAVLWAQQLRGSEHVNVKDYGPERGATGRPGVLAPLPPLVRRAEETFRSPVFAVVVNHPGDAGMTVQVYGTTSPATQDGKLLSTRGMLTFDGVSGALLDTRMPHTAPANGARATMATLDELHRLHFAGGTIRWLYFISGLAGSAMMASGAILFMVKRRQKSQREFGTRTPQVYRLIEVLNVAAIAGLSLACIGFLWANRLIPPGIDERHDWEITAFFGLWLATLLHAALRPALQAWREQLLAAAALCLLLPLLNAATAGQHLAGYAAAGDWQRGGVELASLGFGLLFIGAARRVRAKPGPDKAQPDVKPGPDKAQPGVKPGPDKAQPGMKPGPALDAGPGSQPAAGAAARPVPLSPAARNAAPAVSSGGGAGKDAA